MIKEETKRKLEEFLDKWERIYKFIEEDSEIDKPGYSTSENKEEMLADLMIIKESVVSAFDGDLK